jgi:hypothetical protein
MSALELSLLIDEDGETTRLEEETVLLSPFVLEMLARLEGILQLPHAQREALHRQLGHHLGRDGLAVGARRKVVVGRDPGRETHREVGQDRDQSSVFVQPRERFRRELRTDAGTDGQRLSDCSHDWAASPGAPRVRAAGVMRTRRRRASTLAIAARRPFRLEGGLFVARPGR